MGREESKKKKKMSLLERYLVVEIVIEFKACLFFFCIMFFYCTYRVVSGSTQASILHMTEMISLTYVMGYLQYYLLNNFDEGDRVGFREICYMLICVGIYVAVSYLGGWFDRSMGVTVGYTFYMILAYVGAFWVYRVKRRLDAKQLNEDLKAFQKRRQNEDSH